MTRTAASRFLFAAALACTFAFGAAQAFAAPSAGSSRKAGGCAIGCVYVNRQCICEYRGR